MKLYSCSLKHKGGTTMVLPLERVTAAEVVVLRAVHGDDAVIRIKHIGERPVSQENEFARLAKKFEGHKIEGGGNIVAHCFPGASPVLPDSIPPRQRTIEEKAAADAHTISKDELEKDDELLKQPVAVDEDADETDSPDYEEPSAGDVIFDEKAA